MMYNYYRLLKKEEKLMPNDTKKRGPIGTELVRRGIVTERDIQRAIEYQRANPR